VEAVLQADGVTPEMLKALQAKGALLGELLSVADDAGRLEALVRERNADVDQDLFIMATNVLQESASTGQMPRAARAARVREAILEHSTWGQEALAEARKQQAEQKAEAQTELLEAILAAEDDEELETLLAVNRPLVDEDLYRLLTQRAEEAKQAGDGEQAKRLRSLRGHIRNLTKKVDREMEEEIGESLKLLSILLEAKDMAAAVEEHADELSPLLLQILNISAEQALEEGRRDIAARLVALERLVQDALIAQAPVPVRLLEMLLDTKDAAKRREIMEEYRDHVNYDFLVYLDGILNEAELDGQWTYVNALRQIRQEVQEFAQG